MSLIERTPLPTPEAESRKPLKGRSHHGCKPSQWPLGGLGHREGLLRPRSKPVIIGRWLKSRTKQKGSENHEMVTNGEALFCVQAGGGPSSEHNLEHAASDKTQCHVSWALILLMTQ